MECGCPCTPCSGGYHIFCNQFPHGNFDEAVRWFREHPEAAASITPLGEKSKAAMDEAKRLGPIK